MFLANRVERNRFIRFALVGLSGTLVDFGVFNLLLINWHSRPLIASTISFTAAITNNFLLNRIWTYPDSRSKPVSKQLGQYTVINLAGLAIRAPIILSLERFFRGLAVYLQRMLRTQIASEMAGYNLALASAIIVVLFWNFLANRYWTYNDIDALPLSDLS